MVDNLPALGAQVQKTVLLHKEPRVVDTLGHLFQQPGRIALKNFLDFAIILLDDKKKLGWKKILFSFMLVICFFPRNLHSKVQCVVTGGREFFSLFWRRKKTRHPVDGWRPRSRIGDLVFWVTFELLPRTTSTRTSSRKETWRTTPRNRHLWNVSYVSALSSAVFAMELAKIFRVLFFVWECECVREKILLCDGEVRAHFLRACAILR